MFDLIVIGAGPGGYEAAAHAARMGRKVALIEKARVGGTCLNVGCIPAKTFLRSSKLFHECQEAAPFGVRVAPPEFDMPSVVARKDRVVGKLIKGVEGMLKRTGVTTLQGTAKLLSRDTVQVDGERIQGRNILIATGSRPAVPPIPGIDSARVLDSNTVFALASVPARVVIVGGGYIGLEFACFFREIGVGVTVFEMLPHIAAGSDQEIASKLLRILTARRIGFRLSCKVLAIDGATIHYVAQDGSKSSDSADYVLNATGRAPSVHGLGLEDVGVDYTARGIRTTDRGKTNVPGIWACGDVTGRRMLAHAAAREGLVAVNNMFGGKDRIRYDAVPAVIYTHPEVASVGMTEEELKAAGIEYRKSVVPMAVAGRFLVENEDATGFVKVLAGARYGDLLGVHAIGDASSEFIVAAAAMVGRRASAAEASEVIYPHPTVSEALKEAILGVH